MITETARQRRTRENQQKIFDAVKTLLSQYDYSAFTVKNICDQAGVSNGSFFHYFNSKEDLLAFYLNEGFRDYLAESSFSIDELPDFSQTPLKSLIIDLYLNYARYCIKSGVDFISDYYSTSNPALSVHLSKGDQPGDIVSEYIVRAIKLAQEKELVPVDLDAEQAERDLCILVKGSIFDWCLNQGETNLEDTMQRLLTIYIEDQLTSSKSAL